MKIKIYLCVFVLLLAYQSFSQNKEPEKHVIIYKTIEGHDIKANVFLPEQEGLHPVLVYFHGGGFIFGNRDQGLNNLVKEKLLEANFAVVSADYRLAPETKLHEIIEDAQDIIKWLRKNGMQEFNIDTNKIAVAGGSAGGYLAFSTGFKKDVAPNAIVAISTPTGFIHAAIQMGDTSTLNQPGPYDIVKDSIVSYGDYSSRMTLWRYLAKNRLSVYEVFGFNPVEEPDKLEQYTLSNNVKSYYPPTLLIHAKNDHLVDVQQVKEFHEFLLEQKLKSELYLLENGHSSELIRQNPQAIDKLIQFLNEQM